MVTAALGLLLLTACSDSTTEPDGPEYLDYSTPDNLVANLGMAWERMDVDVYADSILYDGSELATDGEAYSAFTFLDYDDGLGWFWAFDDEIEMVSRVFSGGPAQDFDIPGIEAIELLLEPLTPWLAPDPEEEPEGLVVRRYATDFEATLTGVIPGTEITTLRINTEVDLYAIPVIAGPVVSYRIWKWEEFTPRTNLVSEDPSVLRTRWSHLKYAFRTEDP